MSIEEQAELARQTPMGRPNGTPGWTQEDEDARRAAGIETCWICGKEKGQPPERCNGHYEGTPSDWKNFKKAPIRT